MICMQQLMRHPSLTPIRKEATTLDRRLCVAPMLDWTDRHERFFLRRITRHTLLYTEMVTTGALLCGHGGNPEGFLAHDPEEHPLALQLGGNDPDALARCARLGEDNGYGEINLNCGCPSDRVRQGRFGACLLAEPALTARCVDAMRRAVSIPVTVKTRIAIGEPGAAEEDTHEELFRFVETVAAAGCRIFIIHARKAWLGYIPPGGKKIARERRGPSPAENRKIPPLRHDVARALKRAFPTLEIVLNGGIEDVEAARGHLRAFDGAMIGRAAYHHPYRLAPADEVIFGDRHPIPSRREVIESFLPYVEKQLACGVPLGRMTRHILGLFSGQPWARAWRRTISERAHLPGAGVEVIRDALEAVLISHRRDYNSPPCR